MHIKGKKISYGFVMIKKCQHCDYELGQNIKFCPMCGKDINEHVSKKLTNDEKGRIDRYIKYGAFTGFISAGITAVGAFANNPIFLIDALLAFLLSIGILSYKSRACSIVILLHFISSKVVQLFNVKLNFYSALIFAAISIIFICLFFLSILGTFEYHENKGSKLNLKGSVLKIVSSLAYGLLTFLVFLFVVYLLNRYFPGLSNNILAVILFLPVELMIFLSLSKKLPFTKNIAVIK